MTVGVVMFLAGAAFLQLLFFIVRYKKQLSEMTEALKEVKMGKRKQKDHAAPGEWTAPLAYEFNGIIRSYEERILALNKAEETNKAAWGDKPFHDVGDSAYNADRISGCSTQTACDRR